MSTPYLLALSMTSAKAILAAFDANAENCLASLEWNNLEGAELAESLQAKFTQLQAEVARVGDYKISKVFGVEGPGSFTGLRVSSAFLKGLATGLNVPLVGIASFDLYGEPFAFSLRPAKAATLTLEECVQKEFKFLQVESSQVSVVVQPGGKVVGLKDAPLWPSLAELQAGVIQSLGKTSYELNYGYTPEFVTAKS